MPSPDSQFHPTSWTLILAARAGDREAPQALETLCANYWYPLYAFTRRQGASAEDAQDLTQSFFATLLEKNWLDDVAQEKGRFRSFLLAAMKHFLANERDRARAQKRGGRLAICSLDAVSAESRYALEPIDAATPERIFDRRCAITLLEQVLTRLRAEFAANNNAALFDALKPSLTGQPTPHAEVAVNLGMTEGSVKVAAHRLRNRYRDLIREEVSRTVATESEVDAEIQDLLSALSIP